MSYIETTEEYGIININSPTHGQFKVLIDLDDIDKCNSYTWSMLKSVSGKNKEYMAYYATNYEIGLLHRFIMEASKDIIIDHKDGNTLDDRKFNLRECTSSENSMNQKKRKSESGITGVLWNKKTKSWMAYMKIHNKFKNLGYYHDKDEAIKSRKEAETKYFGEYMRNENNTYDL